MSVNHFIISAIFLGGLVTVIPKVLPFVLVKYRGLPLIVERFLHYLPIAIIFALILSSMVDGKPAHLPSIKWGEFLVALVTGYIAFRYKNLLVTVLFGMMCMALFRFFF